jgi:hypothetical protein
MVLEVFMESDYCCFRSLYAGREKHNWYLDLEILTPSLGSCITSKLIGRVNNQICKHLD